jgi:hypothetical protein
VLAQGNKNRTSISNNKKTIAIIQKDTSKMLAASEKGEKPHS